MENLWTIVCESTAFDQTTHRPSLFHCITEGVMGKFPKKMPPVHVVSSWVIEDEGEYSLAIELVRPDGTVKQVGKAMKQTMSEGGAVLDVGQVVIEVHQHGLHRLRVKCKRGRKVCLGQEARLMISPPPSSETRLPSKAEAEAESKRPKPKSKPVKKAK